MKTRLLLSSLLLASGAFAATPGKSCCAAKPAATVAAAGTFTRESVYQLDLRFTDDRGDDRTLGQLRGRPVAVAMFFASCTYACPLIVADLTRVRAALPAEVRDEAVILLVSFDSERDTVPVLHQFRTDRLLDDGWELWRGDAGAVRELATLLGVNYKPEADGQFAHTNLITVLNREGEIMHHRLGLKGGLDGVVAALTAPSAQ